MTEGVSAIDALPITEVEVTEAWAYLRRRRRRWFALLAIAVATIGVRLASQYPAYKCGREGKQRVAAIAAAVAAGAPLPEGRQIGAGAAYIIQLDDGVALVESGKITAGGPVCPN